MLSLFLLSVVVGQTAAPELGDELPIGGDEAEFVNEVEEFEQGTAAAIPEGDTLSATIGFDLELLPTYTKGTFDSGTSGLAAIGSNGVGLSMSIDPMTIDIAFLQLEPDELKGLKDALDTVDFTVKMTGAYSPTLEFGIHLQGQEPSTGNPESKTICFRDTMDTVEMFLGKLGRRLSADYTVQPSTWCNDQILLDSTGGEFVMQGELPTCQNWCDNEVKCNYVGYIEETHECEFWTACTTTYSEEKHAVYKKPSAGSEPPCLDDPAWTDSYGDTCEWYGEHDPGCTYYTAPDGDYGQFDKCKATCNTCTGAQVVETCPAHPVVTFEGTMEYIHYCLSAQDTFAVFGPTADEEGPLKAHAVTSIDLTLNRPDETELDVTFSLTGPDSPDFELKGTLAFTDFVSPDPQSTGNIPLPSYCTDWLSVASLVGEEKGPTESFEESRYCDFTSPEVEPCCLETSYDAQDACLAAKGTGGHLCDETDPTVEPCCLHTTYEDQDSCLEEKGVTYRALGEKPAVDALTKKIALQTLKKLHGAKGTAEKLFKDYKEEKSRLVRNAIIGYTVAGVIALFLALGAVRSYRLPKSYVVAPTSDEEMRTEHPTLTE